MGRAALRAEVTYMLNDRILGNTKNDFNRDICQRIKAYGEENYKEIAELAKLCPDTVRRFVEKVDNNEPYDPMSSTIVRLSIALGRAYISVPCDYKPAYRNKEKE